MEIIDYYFLLYLYFFRICYAIYLQQLISFRVKCLDYALLYITLTYVTHRINKNAGESVTHV